MGEYSIKVTLGDAVVEVSGDDRVGLVEIVRELTDSIRPRVLALPPGPPAEPTDASSDAARSSTDRTTVTDPRMFFGNKNPSTMIEAAVTGIFYATTVAPEGERLESVDKAELEEVFRLANRKLPSRSQQLLIDAYNAGYLQRVSQGRYRLNNVGHNLVAHTLGSGG